MREQSHTPKHVCTAFVACIFVSDMSHPGIRTYSASWDSRFCGRHNILVDSSLQHKSGTEIDKIIRAMARDFQQCSILTSVDSDEPGQPPLKPRNLK